MKTIVPVVILSFLLTLSCEEKIQCPVQIETKPNFILRAGDALSDSVVYHEFDPYLTVKGIRNGVDTNYYYHDSVQLDLNEDKTYDLYYEYHMYYTEYYCDTSGANDSVAIDCFPDADALCRMKTYGNVEIAFEETVLGLLPKKFNLGDTIDSQNHWSNINDKKRFAFPGSLINWNSNEFTKYMGFRIIDNSDTLYGWIRLNTLYSSQIEIYDYAIERYKH